MQRLGVLGGLDARAHVGLGDDLEQWRASAVEVDAGLACVVFVQRFAGVFLEVGAGQVDAVQHLAHIKLDRAALHHRRLVLADLVALGQVGIKVVLARKDRLMRHARTHRHAKANGTLDGAAVHHRQGAGQCQING